MSMPVSGVTVTALQLGVDPELPSTTESAGDGAFSVPGLTGGGVYRVFASSAAWRSPESWVTTSVGAASDSTLLRVTPASTLSGVVMRDGEPCAEGELIASGPSVTSAVRTGSDGSVALQGLPPGIYSLAAYCAGALPRRESLELGSQPVQRSWGLSSGLSVRGRVENARGMPVAGAFVRVVPVGEPVDRLPTHCVSEPSGEFRCSGLSAGAHDCTLESDHDPLRESVRVTLDAGSSDRILLRARPSATIRVSVDASARPRSAAVRVFARAAGGPPLEGERRAAVFVFEHLPLGRYEVYVGVPSAHERPGTALLSEDGKVAELTLPAPPLASIRGQALDALGNPWIDAWVRAAPSDPGARPASAADAPTLTDEHGEFTLGDLAPGPYDLLVWGSSRQGQLSGVAAGTSGVVLREHAPLQALSAPVSGRQDDR